MVRYDSDTDSFIPINFDEYTVQYTVEVSDESVEKIADTVVRKLADYKTEPQIERDRPQGKWIKRFGSINCSVCKRCSWSESFEYTVRRFKFCPNCGARMDGEL